MSLVEATRPIAARASSGPTGASRVSPLGWPGAIVGLVLLIWLVPTKRYRLPVDLPFKLEPYRLFILLLIGALLFSALVGRTRINAAGHGKAILLLGGAALAAQAANIQALNTAGLQTQSLKSLSYFLSFLIAFALVCSTLQQLGEVRTIIATIVVGALVVAVAALYESRIRNNLFDSLDAWIPVLQNTLEDKFNYRRGRLRVRASAQHPIALAVVLLMSVPLALYLARHAASKARQWAWAGVAVVIAMGALLTVARTAVTVLVAMVVTAALLRKIRLVRLLPLFAALVLMMHFASPGAMKGLYRAFTPQSGLLSEQQKRLGQSGSGRIADLGPALARWSERPVFGRGLGTSATTAEPAALDSIGDTGTKRIIYDDQYLESLVSLGLVGFLGVLWFVWGAVIKLVRAARRTAGEPGDLLAACAIATAGFAAGMVTFDAFSFVQVTLVFCVIAALGLRARALLKA